MMHQDTEPKKADRAFSAPTMERSIDRVRAIAAWEKAHPDPCPCGCKRSGLARAWNDALAEKRERARPEELAKFITAQEGRTSEFLLSCGLMEQEIEALTVKPLLHWPALNAVNKFLTDKKTFLLLSGQVGGGKTTAAVSVFKVFGKTSYHHPELGEVWEWRNGSCKYVLVPELATGPLFGPEGTQILGRLKSVRCLVLDEFGRELTKEGKPSEVWARALFELIDCRYRSRLPTILVTNMRRNTNREGTEPGFIETYGEAIGRRIKEAGAGPDIQLPSLRAVEADDD